MAESNSGTTEVDSVDDDLPDSQWDLFREALIAEVQRHPTLYGRKHRDTARRKEAWVSVAQALQRFMDDTLNEEKRSEHCKKAWENLRTAYSRELKNELERKMKGLPEKRPPWRFFHSMEFVRPSYQIRSLPSRSSGRRRSEKNPETARISSDETVDIGESEGSPPPAPDIDDEGDDSDPSYEFPEPLLNAFRRSSRLAVGDDDSDHEGNELDTPHNNHKGSHWHRFREALIGEVQKHPVLYTQRLRQGCDSKYKRIEAWSSVTRAVRGFLDESLNEEESVEECKKSWARLRMAFHRELRIEHRNLKEGKRQKQPWKCFHSLDFLRQDCRIGSSQKSDQWMKLQKPKLPESSKAARSAAPDSNPAGPTPPTKKSRQGDEMTEVTERPSPTLPESEMNCSSLPEPEVDEKEDNSDAAFQESSGRISPSRVPGDTLEEYVHFPSDVDRRPGASAVPLPNEPVLDEVDYQVRAWASRIKKYDARQRRALMRRVNDCFDDMEAAFESSATISSSSGGRYLPY